VTPVAKALKSKVFAFAYSPSLPFEWRCRLLYWDRRRSWHSRQPVTFSQKVIWKMLKDRRPVLTTLADKVAVRDYVARAVGPEVLTELHAVVTDPDELEPDRLPARFVVKPNHASGMIWIVGDEASSHDCQSDDSTHQVSDIFTTTPDGLDWDLLRRTCRRWLSMNYADVELEWAYRHIPPRIMVEELLVGADGHVPPDYKFYVFHGRVRLLEVHTDRFGDHRCNLVRPDWSPVDAQLIYPPAVHAPARPESLDQMIRIAETLGQDTDFVRVDLYDVDGRIVFGELTSNPGGPYAPGFTPRSFDLELGRYWNLPDEYR